MWQSYFCLPRPSLLLSRTSWSKDMGVQHCTAAYSYLLLFRTYLQLWCPEYCGSIAENSNQELFSKGNVQGRVSTSMPEQKFCTEDTLGCAWKKGENDNLGRSFSDGRCMVKEGSPGNLWSAYSKRQRSRNDFCNSKVDCRNGGEVAHEATTHCPKPN